MNTKANKAKILFGAEATKKIVSIEFVKFISVLSLSSEGRYNYCIHTAGGSQFKISYRKKCFANNKLLKVYYIKFIFFAVNCLNTFSTNFQYITNSIVVLPTRQEFVCVQEQHELEFSIRKKSKWNQLKMHHVEKSPSICAIDSKKKKTSRPMHFSSDVTKQKKERIENEEESVELKSR